MHADPSSSFGARSLRRLSAVALGLVLASAAGAQPVARGATVRPADHPPSSFSVVFDGCTEFAGLGPLAATQIQGLIPSGYTVASFGPGTVGIVARAARCDQVSVDGGAPERASVSHVGINLVAPDGTGDINNYTLIYVTDSQRLADRLSSAGLPVRVDPKLVYEANPAGAALELFVQVDAKSMGLYFLHGSVVDPAPGTQFPFLANWWYDGRAGRLKMSTQIPAFAAGTADVALYAARGSAVGQLTAANRTTFPLLSVRGKFDHAVMTVTLGH